MAGSIYDPLFCHPAQDLTDPAWLDGGGEPLPLLLGIFLDALARIATLRAVASRGTQMPDYLSRQPEADRAPYRIATLEMPRDPA